MSTVDVIDIVCRWIGFSLFIIAYRKYFNTPFFSIFPRGETDVSDFSRRHERSLCPVLDSKRRQIGHNLRNAAGERSWSGAVTLDTKSIRSIRNQSARRVRRTRKRSIVRPFVRNRRIRRGGIDQRSAIGLTSSSGRYTLLEPVDTLNSSNRVLGCRRVLPLVLFKCAISSQALGDNAEKSVASEYRK